MINRYNSSTTRDWISQQLIPNFLQSVHVYILQLNHLASPTHSYCTVQYCTDKYTHKMLLTVLVGHSLLLELTILLPQYFRRCMYSSVQYSSLHCSSDLTTDNRKFSELSRYLYSMLLSLCCSKDNSQIMNRGRNKEEVWRTHRSEKILRKEAKRILSFPSSP